VYGQITASAVENKNHGRRLTILSSRPERRRSQAQWRASPSILKSGCHLERSERSHVPRCGRLKHSVIPTGARRSQANWRDLVSHFVTDEDASLHRLWEKLNLAFGWDISSALRSFAASMRESACVRTATVSADSNLLPGGRNLRSRRRCNRSHAFSLRSHLRQRSFKRHS
jgi:hypothetical protein